MLYVIVCNFTGNRVASTNNYKQAQLLLDIFEETTSKTHSINRVAVEVAPDYYETLFDARLAIARANFEVARAKKAVARNGGK